MALLFGTPFLCKVLCMIRFLILTLSVACVEIETQLITSSLNGPHAIDMLINHPSSCGPRFYLALVRWISVKFVILFPKPPMVLRWLSLWVSFYSILTEGNQQIPLLNRLFMLRKDCFSVSSWTASTPEQSSYASIWFGVNIRSVRFKIKINQINRKLKIWYL